MSGVSRREFNMAFLTGFGLGRVALPSAPHVSAEDDLQADLPGAEPARVPLIFPEPREMTMTGEDFGLDEDVTIVMPVRPSSADIQLVRVLSRDLSDRYRLGIKPVRAATAPEDKRVILLGSTSNPLVKGALERQGATTGHGNLGREGYLLQVNERQVLVAGSDDDGAFYGVQSLRQLIYRHGGRWRVRGVTVRDWPYKPFRGIYLFLPGRDHIPFFKRFICDFVALYKFNKVILEFNAGMRFDRHPELAAGWIDFAQDMYYTRRERPDGPHGVYQDSANCNSVYGVPIEKAEVEDIVRWANESHIEVIPDVASLTHSYYLLTRHRELAAIPTAEWPDTYCPSSPSTYDLLFDVLDEVIETTHPRMIHIGHDEWRVPLNLCPCCSGKNPTELFIQDVNKIHQHLRERNIRVAMWGDHFIESLRGKGERSGTTKTGFHYEMPGALSPEQIRRFIPKDILVFNWFWTVAEHGEASQDLLTNLGFEQVYGNFEPDFPDYARRSAEPGILGGAPSLWSPTTEFNFCKDVLCDFLGTANLLWGTRWPEEPAGRAVAQALVPKVYGRMRGRRLPSETGDSMSTIPVASSHDPVPIHADASSVIFLHHAAASAFNENVYTAVYNSADTAALLGWYEVLYEDGFVETAPIRYGVNILESDWSPGKSPAAYCFEATAVTIGRQTFFSYEWVNPRFGKRIRQIRLHQTNGLTDLQRHSSPPDVITLHSIGVVHKRSFPGADREQDGAT